MSDILNTQLNDERDTTTDSTERESSEDIASQEREAAARIARTSDREKVGSALSLLEVERETFINSGGTPENFQPSNNALQIINNQVVIQAVAQGEDPSSLMSDLGKLGASNLSSFNNVVSAFVPLDKINTVAGLSSLKFSRPAYQAYTNAGKVTSQGDRSLEADTTREQFKLDGSGITIGVLSDSYDKLGGADADILSGDLPGEKNPNEKLTPVNVLQEYSEADATDEGRAMLQLIHDVAPGAALAFHTAFITPVEFANGIGKLVNSGADIVVDDVGYFTEPFFQNGIIAQAANQAFANGVAYFSAAGNSGSDSYESSFNPGNAYPKEFFAGGFFGGVAHQFAPGDELQEFVLEAGESVTLSFQWDDPFVSAGGKGATRDLDVYILNAQGDQVIASSADLNIDKDAVEILNYTNEGETTQTYNLMLVHNTGVGSTNHPSLIKYIDFDGQAEFTEYTTNSSTVFGHPNADGAVGVGAADYSNTPAFGKTPPELEDFSSVGGTPILFDDQGNRLSTPNNPQQPLIVAPDGTDTTFFGGEDVDETGFPNFFGTSAAAPHAAAVAALMLQGAGGKGSLTPTQIYNALAKTAIDMNEQGFDLVSGFGLIDAQAATFAVTHGVTITPVNDDQIIEGLSTNYQVVLTTKPTANVSINFQVNESLIEAIPTITFTPDNWEQAQTLTITSKNNSVAGDNAITIQPLIATGSAAEYANIEIPDFFLNIVDNENPGVTILQTGGGTQVSEGGDSDKYNIVLNRQPENNVTINIVADSQQVNTNASVTFTPSTWNIPQEVTVSAVDDSIAEGDHTSTISYEVNPNSSAEYLNVNIQPLPVNITDNDQAEVVFATGQNVDVTENGLVGTYQLELKSQPTKNVVIDLTNDEQIQLLKGDQVINSVTFTPNNWNTAQNITVKAVNDNAEEGLHTSIINHKIAEGSAAEYLTQEIGDVTINIVDNESVGITVIPAENLNVTEDGETDKYKIILDQEPTQNVTLNFSPNSQIKLTNNQGETVNSILFNPNNWNQFQEVTVTAIDDQIAEGDNTSNIIYNVASDSAPEYLDINLAPISVSIKDNDRIGIEILPTNDKTEISEDGATDTYTVKLKSKPTNNVFIQINTDEKQINKINTLVFTPNTWNTPQSVTVKAFNDKLVEDSPHVSVITHVVRNDSAAEYLILAQANLSVNILDNDVPGVIIEETDNNTKVTKGLTIDDYLVTLNSQPTKDVTVIINTDNQIEKITAIKFTPQNWNTPQKVTVIAVNTPVVEPDKESIITHSIAQGSAAEYLNALIDEVDVTISDDPNKNNFPNNGDNNKDGILDSQQNNVSSVLTLGDTATQNNVLTVVSPEETILNLVQFQTNPAPEADNNPEANGVLFPIDFLNLRILNFPSGDKNSVTLLLPESTNNQAYNTYWLSGKTPDNNQDHWFNFVYDGETGAKFIDTNGNGKADQVILNFVDGKRGDLDLENTGVVSALGAAGVVASEPKFTRENNNVINISGEKEQAAFLKVQRQSSNSNDINEVGVFKVDAENKVNGIAPGSTKYVEAALSQGTVLMSSLDKNSNELLQGVNLSRQLQYSTGDRLVFYIVKNGTTDSGANAKNIFFSLKEANLDFLNHVSIKQDGNNLSLAWETATAGDDLSFDDLVITTELNNQVPGLQQLIADTQGEKEGELIDLTNFNGRQVQSKFDLVKSEASYNNIVGLYRTENRTGTVVDPITGQTFTPGQSGYLKAAVRQSQTTGNGINFERNSAGKQAVLEGGNFYAPFIIADGTVDAVLDDNSSNDPAVYFAFGKANQDRVDHVLMLGDNTFGFEDLRGGGDKDYNDIVFQANFALI